MSLEAAETLAKPKNKHIISKALMMKKLFFFKKNYLLCIFYLNHKIIAKQIIKIGISHIFRSNQ
ncbi:hypothetical protein MARBORIA2_08170 [Methanobrevibacter arboriphilus]|uniref:Uncharacterized protein n=1 Tax=Methanobrevibacter arboriphilus TaxID=39441 RepID=A0ACA8R4F5_METAZ|nr:hypothetical protein MarbSA_12930 [Methanobrevibacter arboriphilus]GLI11727.1 hypothetical protein MARBORIA2_08170 [Methanobrevibacter arboriphilus]